MKKVPGTKDSAPSRRRAMPQNSTVQPCFQFLQQFDAFQAANPNVFPSVSSLRWFYRIHRDELLNAGSVVELAGRIMINAPVFAEAVLRIGARAVAARCENSAKA